jgi:hypothetical protein
MHFPSDALEQLFFEASTIVVEPAVLAAAYHYLRRKRDSSLRGIRVRPRRQRVSVLEVFNFMGPRIFRRAFRMTFDSFWRLHTILLPFLRIATDKKINYERKGGRSGGNYSLPPIPKGVISPSIRLGAAIRYFAGGSPYDIMCVFGISYSEVLLSVWIVVDAINQCPQFNISYPDSLEEQIAIAAGFEAASTPGIKNCAGAIDGVLIWMLKPSLKEAKKTGIDQKKFLCGRKHKFGLNCQAVSDCRGRILDISIKYGGASSDCLSFEASELYGRVIVLLLVTINWIHYTYYLVLTRAFFRPKLNNARAFNDRPCDTYHTSDNVSRGGLAAAASSTSGRGVAREESEPSSSRLMVDARSFL